MKNNVVEKVKRFLLRNKIQQDITEEDFLKALTQAKRETLGPPEFETGQAIIVRLTGKKKDSEGEFEYRGQSRYCDFILKPVKRKASDEAPVLRRIKGRAAKQKAVPAPAPAKSKDYTFRDNFIIMLRRDFRYRNGILIKNNSKPGKKIGEPIGGLWSNLSGWHICLDRVILSRADAVFLYFHGYLPETQLKRKDGSNIFDDRITNLEVGKKKRHPGRVRKLLCGPASEKYQSIRVPRNEPVYTHIEPVKRRQSKATKANREQIRGKVSGEPLVTS